MLKKMRWHFILAAMLAVFIMLVTVLAGVNVWNYYTTAARADQRIQEIYDFEAGRVNADQENPKTQNAAEQSAEGITDSKNQNSESVVNSATTEKSAPPDVFNRPEDYDPEAPYTTRFFLVHLDEEQNVTDVSTDFIASVTQKEAEAFARNVLNGKREQGYYKNYRFRIITEENNNIVIFLNSIMELRSARNVLLISCLVGAVCFLAVFILVILLSKKAMKPYIQNIERQKRFITDASHEIKTPLTSIATSVDVIALEHGEDEWTKNIHTQTTKMSKMVSDLVTLSRLDEENPFLDKTEFSLSDVTWEVAEPFASLAKAQGKNYSQRIEENLALCGNSDATRQMVSVLLDNAMKYSDENGTIRLDVYKAHGKTKIEVFNTCVLEDTKNLNRLFDRFYRPDNSRSRKTGGSGIGLSIAQAVAEAYGGKIKVSSKDGKSILFQVTI